jgi:hypothetical protein
MATSIQSHGPPRGRQEGWDETGFLRGLLISDG